MYCDNQEHRNNPANVNTPDRVSRDRVPVFRSFWMAGFEGADHVNSAGIPLDMGSLTQHAQFARQDYELLRDFGIETVRESVGWRLVEKDGKFDFSSLQSRLEAARQCKMQVLWTLCHYGWPDDLDVFSDEWIDRFALFCQKTSAFLALQGDDVPVYTPINEISFLTWAICESSLIHPHRGDRTGDAFGLKQRLVKAFMAGCDAIWQVDPRARILSVDPMIHIVPPPDRPELAREAEQQRSYQFQAWDMLAGLKEPQLGGHPKYLDMVGVNYYHSNQWEYGTYEPLFWHLQDARRIALSDLLKEVWQRYGHALVLAETSHVGVGRADWIRDIAQDVIAALQAGVPIEGICLYPIIDRPDWEDLEHWHNSGLWDLCATASGLERRMCQPYAQEIRCAQDAVQLVLKALKNT